MKHKSSRFYSKLSIGIFLALLCFFTFGQSSLDINWRENSSEITNNLIHEEEGENRLLQNKLNGFNSETVSLVSWNIQDFGRSKSSESIYEIANILRDFDVVAIQEVVAKDPAGAQAIAKIADELNRMGAKWDYQISNPTKSPSVYMSERYAFLWKTSKVTIVHKAYLDDDLKDLCYREPYIGAFRVKGKNEQFYVVNYHSRKYNDKPEEEIIHFINYPERLVSDKILIAGDFNLNERHDVWKPFYKVGFKSALNNEKTTLKRKCFNGIYRNHDIDNIYITSGIELITTGIVDFVKPVQSFKVLEKFLIIYLCT